jgi:hypothetical protein
VEIKLVKQAKAPVKFHAEAKSEHKISSQFRAAKDKVDLRQFWILPHTSYRQRGCWFIEAHFLLRLELAHHLQKRRNFLVREKLKECIHKAILAERVFSRGSLWL